jgi:hypothetical protein
MKDEDPDPEKMMNEEFEKLLEQNFIQPGGTSSFQTK